MCVRALHHPTLHLFGLHIDTRASTSRRQHQYYHIPGVVDSASSPDLDSGSASGDVLSEVGGVNLG